MFCKSYAGDFDRAARLIESVARYNLNRIPFFLCVPPSDLTLFEKLTGGVGYPVTLISDLEIVQSNPGVSPRDVTGWDGRLAQQALKSEFWRWWLKQNSEEHELHYVCIDSESEFIRDFYKKDFVHESGVPYTICHDHGDLLNLCKQRGIATIEQNFNRDCEIIKKVFGRQGPNYAFSPTPVIWTSKVWQDLEAGYLNPNNITIWDAIREYPNELHWYGESLLHFNSIPLLPRNPLFRVYHYDWEFFERQKSGERLESLRLEFIGILKQSNWDYEMDSGAQKYRKSFLSRSLRHCKRWFRKTLG